MAGATDVVVVGSCNMDLVARVTRLPGRGETIGGTTFDTFIGGKGLNQAVAARRIGAQVALIGNIGADDFGREIAAALAGEQIDTRWLTRAADQRTGTALILVEEHGGANSIVVIPGANGALTPAAVEAAADTIRSAQVLLLQLEVPLETVQRAAEIARSAGVRVLLTPAPARPLSTELLSLIDVLLPNEVEIGQLLAVTLDPIDGARALLAQGCGAVVVTLGARGALLVTSEAVTTIPPFAVEAIDSVAAGDAFAGALGASLALGLALPDALRRASAAGALAVTRRGALPSLPRRAEVEALLRDQ